MSWPNNGLDDDTWEAEVLNRSRALADLAAEEGVIILLENCSGWASQSPAHITRFFEQTNHPARRWVYDTGNPRSPPGRGHARGPA